MTRTIPTIVLTMGDPSGVGPELLLRVLAATELWAVEGRSIATPIVVGCERTLRRCAEQLRVAAPRLTRMGQAPKAEVSAGVPAIFDIPVEGAFEIGQVQANCGRAAFLFVEKAIELCLGDVADGVVTGPLNKAAMHQAGLKFPGHTEIFALRTQAPRWCMMQYSDEITCTFATVHCGYSEVPKLLSTQRVFDTIELTHQALSRLHSRTPKLLVCGLNPHAGEGGLFGNQEEERIIIPAIEMARKAGCDVAGPFPPDTVFVPSRRREMDAAICMYHDQGHIPLKALAFDRAVNTTLGLPVIRTSVDHGTAFDIAWKGVADSGSFESAIRLAKRLSKIAGRD